MLFNLKAICSFNTFNLMDLWLSNQNPQNVILCPDKVGSMKNNTSQNITLKASEVNFRNESLQKGFTRNGKIKGADCYYS